MKLENKVVLVTGGSKGIGAGISKLMAQAGAKVIVNFSSDSATAEKLVAEIEDKGGEAVAMQADVSKAAAVRELFTDIKSRYDKIDVLVNNAGVFDFAPLEGADEASYRKMFDINVLSVLFTSQEAVKLFDGKGGSIINISSFASTRPEPYSLIYAATKSAIDSITTSLSQELGTHKIRVNSIRPGGVFTEGVAKLGMTEDSEANQQMISRTALGRMAQPEDIGKLAVFLASDDSSFVTGQKIEVSGGFK